MNYSLGNSRFMDMERSYNSMHRDQAMNNLKRFNGETSPSSLSDEFNDFANDSQDNAFFKNYETTEFYEKTAQSSFLNSFGEDSSVKSNNNTNSLLLQKAEAEYQLMIYQKMVERENRKLSYQNESINLLSIDSKPTSTAIQPPPGILLPSTRNSSSLLIVPPTAPAPTPSSQGVLGKVYQVQFKMGKRYFLRDPQVTADLGVTDYVVVEADRGIDMGVVSGVLTTAEFMEFRARMKALDHSIYSPRRILRVASPVEQMNYLQKARDEEEAVEFANMLASTIHQLPLVVCDAEYQFDRNKLTVYYQSSGRVDFREMVRDMFAMFKVRIWMEKIEPTTTSGNYGY